MDIAAIMTAVIAVLAFFGVWVKVKKYIRVAKEGADILAAIWQAVEDGTFSPQEAEGIKREINEFRQALGSL